jgi:hypothetical protein
MAAAGAAAVGGVVVGRLDERWPGLGAKIEAASGEMKSKLSAFKVPRIC